MEKSLSESTAQSPDPQPDDFDKNQRAGMSESELAEAKRYGRSDLACSLADKVIDLVFLAIIAFVFARPLDDWLRGFTILDRVWSLRLVALSLTVTAIHVCVSFPLTYYSGFVLEHRFSLSTQTFAAWLWRYVKRLSLSVGFGLFVLLGLYWLIWTVGPWWWAAGAGAFFAVSVVLGRLAPVLIMPLFYKIEKLDAPELAQRISKLAEGTGLSIEGVYRIQLSRETVKANAMLAGLGATRRVLLGDTLLGGFTPEEIEVIFAHEIGHHVFRHIHKIIIAGIFYSAAGFWICDRLLHDWVVQVQGEMEYSSLPIYTLPMLMLILTVFATLLEPLQNAISRHYERQSDRYALTRTGMREAYVSAFRKLAKLNKDDPDPPRLEVLLFHSHPPIAERLAMAETRDSRHIGRANK
jgi:STE24 endopeptidase